MRNNLTECGLAGELVVPNNKFLSVIHSRADRYNSGVAPAAGIRAVESIGEAVIRKIKKETGCPKFIALPKMEFY